MGKICTTNTMRSIVCRHSNPLGAVWMIDFDEDGNPAVITDPVVRVDANVSPRLVEDMTDWMGHVTSSNGTTSGA